MSTRTATRRARTHLAGPRAVDPNPRILAWHHLALMAFVAVWGFGNVVSNFANQGLAVIFSWLSIMVVYFLPYALMVGEMGATFPEAKAGVASWIRSTLGSGWAYLCGWTYWVVQIPYLAQKPQTLLIGLGWAAEGKSGAINSFPVWAVQLVGLAIFFGFAWLATRGIRAVKLLGTVAGLASLVMGGLYILLMFAAPVIREAQIAAPRLTSWSTYVPDFDLGYFTTIAMLLFAVGGAEKISPYVSNMQDKQRGFSQGLVFMALLVVGSALLGSLALGMMFDISHMDATMLADFKANGQYLAFQKLGSYYGVGNAFLVLYAVANLLAQSAVLLISIDAPLRLLLCDADERYIPARLRQVNQHGAPVNGYRLTALLVALISLLPAIGAKTLNELFSNLLDLNAVVMPMRYLFVFAAYIALRKLATQTSRRSEYRLVENDAVAVGLGVWCFAFTVVACLLGMIPAHLSVGSAGWWGKLALNVITPLALVSLGLILPLIAERQLGLNRRARRRPGDTLH
ncbi:Inner membrane transporter ycaM [Actinomyces bovis]|uniref:Inner membrane transporter ycaM n=1 Tax=Actinomyces bovis TaxID=1658 RepID=A0ABY1VTG2_9ACTO|nr:amino acid permease [Actinomyces bovis]SPT54313.1 Inner membrane transporter ycaM [Actinomyces bovis]VEG56327.1 Inner membrane transporter ycaM [Actinomyces israelii]